MHEKAGPKLSYNLNKTLGRSPFYYLKLTKVVIKDRNLIYMHIYINTVYNYNLGTKASKNILVWQYQELDTLDYFT